jgi:hypothetical protein
VVVSRVLAKLLLTLASHVAESKVLPMDDNEQLPGCFSFVPFKFLSRNIKRATAEKCKSPTVETTRVGAQRRRHPCVGVILTCAQKSILEPCGDGDECKIGETPPSYSSAVPDDEPILRPDVLKTIDARIDKLDPELRKLSLQIHGALDPVHLLFSLTSNHNRPS